MTFNRFPVAAMLAVAVSVCWSGAAVAAPTTSQRIKTEAAEASGPPAARYERTFQSVPEGAVAEVAGRRTAPEPAQAATARTPRGATRVAQVNIVGGNSGGQSAGKARPPLDDDSLGEMLENLGMNVQTIELDSGSKVYRVEIERRDWKTVQYVELSPNKKYMWHTSYLVELKDPPSDKLMRILGLSGKFGPPFFQVDTSDNTLALLQAIPNNNLSPKDMRELLVSFSDVIIDTAPEWQEAD